MFIGSPRGYKNAQKKKKKRMLRGEVRSECHASEAGLLTQAGSIGKAT